MYEEHVAREGLPLKPGVVELLGDLAARKIPLGVATSTRNPAASRRLEQAGLLQYFTVLITGDQITHGKPAPDIYLEAVRQLPIDPARSFALEDSHAGLNVIMVPDLLAPTPEIAQLTHTIAQSLHDVRTLFAA